MKTVQELALFYTKFFVTKTRNDGKEFLSLKDDRPDKLQELVRLVHGDILPNDFKYEFVLTALRAIGNAESDLDEAIQAIEPSVYTNDQLQWLASSLTRGIYCDEAVENYGHSEQGIMGDIAMGMQTEMQEVAGIVLNELNAILANSDF